MNQQYGLIAAKPKTESPNYHECKTPKIKPLFGRSLEINSLFRCKECKAVWAVGWGQSFNNHKWEKIWKLNASLNEWKRAGGIE